MVRKSVWVTLAFAILLASAAFVHAPSTASASPAHVAARQISSRANAPSVVSDCTGPGQHPVYYLNGTTFNNYPLSASACATTPCPYQITGDVPAHSVCLFQNSSYGGHEIDFFGSGCVNLTNYAGPGPGGTWNDAMSSFEMTSIGGVSGAFWWDINDGLYYYLFGPPGSGRVSGTTYIGDTWNDKTSSLQLDPNPGGC